MRYRYVKIIVPIRVSGIVPLDEGEEVDLEAIRYNFERSVLGHASDEIGDAFEPGGSVCTDWKVKKPRLGEPSKLEWEDIEEYDAQMVEVEEEVNDA